MLDTPILFIVFNRADTTKQVFEKIREAQPKQLFVAADGPRENKTGEHQLCQEVRSLILDNIDWECEVKTLFRERNLGCGLAVSGAINWFFEHVEEGIILEDDCLPENSFFNFCEAMLKQYRHQDNIMLISGTNYFFNKVSFNYPYYFSNCVFIWGWATWKRAWQKYNFHVTDINEDTLVKRYANPAYCKLIISTLKKVKDGELDTWDLQWLYTVGVHNGLSIIPIKNQIKNIGYQGTNANNLVSPFFNMPTSSIQIDALEFDQEIKVNELLDLQTMKSILENEKLTYRKSRWNSVKASLRKLWR